MWSERDHEPLADPISVPDRSDDLVVRQPAPARPATEEQARRALHPLQLARKHAVFKGSGSRRLTIVGRTTAVRHSPAMSFDDDARVMPRRPPRRCLVQVMVTDWEREAWHEAAVRRDLTLAQLVRQAMRETISLEMKAAAK